MGMNVGNPPKGLTPAEEAFLQALLREEAHLTKGPATRAALRPTIIFRSSVPMKYTPTRPSLF